MEAREPVVDDRPEDFVEDRGGARWRWLVFPLALLAFVAGFALAPLTPFGDRVPDEGSVEAGFARDMRAHHDQAVAMSLIAYRSAATPQVRALAQDVLITQQSQAGAMGGWLADWGLPAQGPTPRMAWMTGGHEGGHAGDEHELRPDGRMPGMASADQLQALRDARGEDVDRLYLSLLITHHRGALPMAQEAVERSDRPVVVALARSIYDSQSAELEVLRTDLLALGGEVPPDSATTA